MNEKLEKYLINKYVSMPKLFDSLGIEYSLNQNMFCPFHHNEHTPSARLYKNAEGYCMWCFSEAKMYSAWNVYKKFYNINTTQLATLIFEKLPEETKAKVLKEMDIDVEQEQLPYAKSLKDFKFHKIGITELLSDIADSFVDE